MSGSKRRWQAPSATPWDDVIPSDITPATGTIFQGRKLPVADWALRPDGKKPRGLSKNQICIAVGCDSTGISYFSRMGLGKPSKTRVWDAYGNHIKYGSTLIHDMEHSHLILVEKLNLKSEVYNSKLIKTLPDKDNPLSEVNRLCFLLELFLNSHSGFNRDDLAGYLDLFWVMMNEPDNKMEKVAFVLNRAMRCQKMLTYREFYGRKSSSEDCV